MSLDRRLAWVIRGVCLLGVLVAGYLTYVHYAGAASICAVVHGCEVVQKSDWAMFAGIPVALLGLVGYVLIVGSTFLRGELGLMAGALLGVGGFGFSMYLTYREAFSIEAWCMWCVISACLMTILAILTTTRLLKAGPSLSVREAHEHEAELA